MSGESNQFSSEPRSSITCSTPTHTASSISPVQSIGGLCLALSMRCSDSVVSKTASTPTGPLMKKIQGQEALSDMYPPRIGPTIGATTAMVAHSASAWPRFSRG